MLWSLILVLSLSFAQSTAEEGRINCFWNILYFLFRSTRASDVEAFQNTEPSLAGHGWRICPYAKRRPAGELAWHVSLKLILFWLCTLTKRKYNDGVDEIFDIRNKLIVPSETRFLSQHCPHVHIEHKKGWSGEEQKWVQTVPYSWNRKSVSPKTSFRKSIV